MSDQRDLKGYGTSPPDPKWPGSAQIAVQFVLNFEEGGELCILNGDDRSEIRLSDVAVETRIGGRDLNIESSYEYKAAVGDSDEPSMNEELGRLNDQAAAETHSDDWDDDEKKTITEDDIPF